jgi:hypothetical protein
LQKAPSVMLHILVRMMHLFLDLVNYWEAKEGPGDESFRN